MAFKTLTILEKNIGDPLEVVAAPKRIAAPYYGTGGELQIVLVLLLGLDMKQMGTWKVKMGIFTFMKEILL